MNILGHLCFSQNSSNKIVVGFIHKTVSKKKEFFQERDWIKELIFHEELEKFSLSLSSYKRSQKRLNKISNKYRQVIIDLFYDHFFALYWRKNHEYDLAHFETCYHEILRENLSLLPYKSKLVYLAFFDQFPLTSLESISGLHSYMQNMNKHMSFPMQYMNVFEDFAIHYQDFKNDFEDFYSDISLYVVEQNGKSNTDSLPVFEYLA